MQEPAIIAVDERALTAAEFQGSAASALHALYSTRIAGLSRDIE